MILYKNYFKDARHHLTVTIQTRIMLKTKEILTFLVIGFLTFESCHAFYRPMHGSIEKILEKILQDQLERRFGKLPAVTTTQTTTTMVETTTRSTSIESTSHPKTLKIKVCEFKTFEACTLDEWTKFDYFVQILHLLSSVYCREEVGHWVIISIPNSTKPFPSAQTTI